MSDDWQPKVLNLENPLLRSGVALAGAHNRTQANANLQSVASLNKLPLHVLVKRLDSGHFIASVSELADCVAEAENREDAIAENLAWSSKP